MLSSPSSPLWRETKKRGGDSGREETEQGKKKSALSFAALDAVSSFLSARCAPRSDVIRTPSSRKNRMESGEPSPCEPFFRHHCLSGRHDALFLPSSRLESSFSFSLTSVLMRVSLAGSCSCAFQASPPDAAAASVEAILLSMSRGTRASLWVLSWSTARRKVAPARVFFFGRFRGREA